MSDRLSTNSSVAAWHRTFGLGWACAVLSIAVAAAWLVDATVTSHLGGRSFWGVSAAAALVCWSGAMFSLVLLHLLRHRGSPITGLLVGMLIRMAIPLAVATMAAWGDAGPAEAGLLGQLVGFYLFTLTIETCLSLALVKSSPRVASATSHGSASHG